MKCLPSSFNNRAVKETDKDKHRIREQMNNESKRNISRKKSRQIFMPSTSLCRNRLYCRNGRKCSERTADRRTFSRRWKSCARTPFTRTASAPKSPKTWQRFSRFQQRQCSTVWKNCTSLRPKSSCRDPFFKRNTHSFFELGIDVYININTGEQKKWLNLTSRKCSGKSTMS